jgi:hypothetical protein
MPLFNQTKTAFTREKVTVDATVGGVSLTTATYEDHAAADAVKKSATGAKITVETQSIRYTEDGTAPVAAGAGTLATAGTQIILESYQAIKKFKAIRETGSSATIEVVYYR